MEVPPIVPHGINASMGVGGITERTPALGPSNSGAGGMFSCLLGDGRDRADSPGAAALRDGGQEARGAEGTGAVGCEEKSSRSSVAARVALQQQPQQASVWVTQRMGGEHAAQSRGIRGSFIFMCGFYVYVCTHIHHIHFGIPGDTVREG